MDQTTVPTTEKKKVEIPPVIQVRKFAEILEMPASKVIEVLMKNGVMATINESIDFETAAIVADELGFDAHQETEVKKPEVTKSDKKNLKLRPPVVTVMGHVDSGKTSLLDFIRKTSVVAKESGGITQHIGAYQVNLKDKKTKKERQITFLDTPGHEAFSQMRAHGASVTDIVVLVVAADQGVKPQTLEAISHAKAAKVPLVVAINKIDLPSADIEKTKRQLSEIGLSSEQWGGKTPTVEISAKGGTGISELLEMILLVADLQDLKADPKLPGKGVVIESHLEIGKGPLSTVLIQQGTLHLKDSIAVGETYGKIKSLEDFLGKKLKEATPSTAVQISGLKQVPNFGDILEVVPFEKEAREKVESKLREKTIKGVVKSIGLREISSEIREGKIKELNLIIKADVKGSLEAIKDSLETLSQGEVAVKIISQGVGAITESDVNLASASSAIILAFRVPAPPAVLKLALLQKIKISRYEIIYQLIDDIFEALSGMLEPEIVQKEVGKLKVLKVFKKTPAGGIVGGKVISGYLEKGLMGKVVRDANTLGEIKISSLQIAKKPAEKVEEGQESGVGYEGKMKFKEGDEILAIKKEEVIKKLEKKT